MWTHRDGMWVVMDDICGFSQKGGVCVGGGGAGGVQVGPLSSSSGGADFDDIAEAVSVLQRQTVEVKC